MSTIEIPVFPLPNLVFFPQAIVPLHIFEPRYRTMIRDVLKDKKQFGIFLLKPGWEKDYWGAPEIFPIGCLGKIEGYESLPTGHFNVLLRGMYRIRMQACVSDYPYRRLQVQPLTDDDFACTAAEKARLFNHMYEIAGRYMEEILQIDPDAVMGPREENNLEALVNRVAMALDIDVYQKQHLLELSSVEKRYYFVKQAIDDRLLGLKSIKAIDKLDFKPTLN